MEKKTNGESEIVEAILSIYDEIMDARLSLRKISLSAEDVQAFSEEKVGQIALFDYLREKNEAEQSDKGKNTATEGLQRDKLKKDKARDASLQVMQKYGRNSILKAYQYIEGSRGRERNRQIGGHSSGE